MDILTKYFPGDDHVFVYDNATTHKKRAIDSLSARKMPLNPSHSGKQNFGITISNDGDDKVWIPMEDAIHHDGTVQPLYYPSNHDQFPGRFKGMRTLIQERRDHGLDLPDPSKLKAQCTKFHCPPGRNDCCCRRILYTQPDFEGVKSKLDGNCLEHGFQVLYLPKYHCELNFIEQCWGYAKQVYREFPISPLDADLERNVVAALDSGPLTSMRRYES
jgi:hypothetical protein